MNLFRSEKHIERWLAGRDPGATITVTKLSELPHAWWNDRVSPHTRDQNRAVLDGLGLSRLFWKLA